VNIGVLLPVAETDKGEQPRYNDIRAWALQLERDKFDSLWIADHLLFEWPDQPRHGIWEAWTILTALAEATSRITLGTFVACTAFRNPALLAKMTDAVDEVSAGRFVLGLGAGWHEPEFRAFGYPYDHRFSRFADALRVIVPLVRTGSVDYQGRYARAVDCVSLPRGPRPHGPPILVGAGGERMLRLTAELADAWNTCWLGRADELPPRLASMQEACVAVGRDSETLEISVGQIVTFPGLAERAELPRESERFAFSGPEALVEEWNAFAAQGVAHLVIWPMPFNEGCVASITAALRLYRGYDA
jgi:probable F420-dependent oxidoreductase